MQTLKPLFQKFLKIEQLIDTKIINQEQFQQLQIWIGKTIQIETIYRASRDGFSKNKFHELCDNQGKTICIIKSELGQIFGGYCDVSWNNKGKDITNNYDSFLFSLSKNSKHVSLKKSWELYGTSDECQHSNFGMCFGGGFDLAICDKSNTVNKSYSQLGYSYQINANVYQRSYFAGEENFLTDEIEVFKIIS